MQDHGQHLLPEGYRLQEFRVDDILGEGGFGVTYLATDTNLGFAVAIKEYFPFETAARNTDSSVVARPRNHLYRTPVHVRNGIKRGQYTRSSFIAQPHKPRCRLHTSGTRPAATAAGEITSMSSGTRHRSVWRTLGAPPPVSAPTNSNPSKPLVMTSLHFCT